MEKNSKILYQTMIPLEPRTKKNSLEIKFRKVPSLKGFFRKTKYGFEYCGVPFVAQSENYKQYEKDCIFFLNPRPREPIAEKVNIKCLFYRATNRRVDLTNLEEAIDDILVKYHILADDCFNIVCGHDGSRVYVDKENPRTEITIERITE